MSDDSSPEPQVSSPSDTPADIRIGTLPTDVCCHPARDVLAVATVDGDVFVHSYGSTSRQLLHTVHHESSCRKVRFSGDGSLLLTGAKDLCTVDLSTGALVRRLPHSAPIYSLCVVDDHLVATGDDDGNLKVWDHRHSRAVLECRESDDFLSDLAVAGSPRTLLATSGDGTLTAVSLRQRGTREQSEPFDEEFLSLVVLKRGRKVLVGAGDGSINVFSWGQWGSPGDRLLLAGSHAVDSLAALSEDLFCMGTADGSIRVAGIVPNRSLGVVGAHGRFPVESLSVSHDGCLVASCSHDQHVKFWDVSSMDSQPSSGQDGQDFFAGL